MKIFLVVSTMPSWMATGYGASLLAGGHSHLLTSFVEFTKPGNAFGLMTGADAMPLDYKPSIKENKDELQDVQRIGSLLYEGPNS